MTEREEKKRKGKGAVDSRAVRSKMLEILREFFPLDLLFFSSFFNPCFSLPFSTPVFLFLFNLCFFSSLFTVFFFFLSEIVFFSFFDLHSVPSLPSLLFSHSQSFPNFLFSISSPLLFFPFLSPLWWQLRPTHL